MTWTDAFRPIDELPPLGDVFVDPAAAHAYDDGRQQGYAAGLAEGRARGEAMGRSEATECVLTEAHNALDGIVAAAAELRERDATGLVTLSEFAVDLALALAQTIVG